MSTSGFSFVHNAIESGYPIVEAVRAVQPFTDDVTVVDMQSTDNTRKVLEQLSCNVLEGFWEPGQAGSCLARNHALYKECEGDVIWHFEADEVYDVELAQHMNWAIEENDAKELSVYRLQVEQNFQRVRWYPELVHRVFANRPGVVKEGHTTNFHNSADVMTTEMGYLWDVTDCFRDNCIPRHLKQAELWGHQHPIYKFVLHHESLGTEVLLTAFEVNAYLKKDHWIYSNSPFNLPDELRNWVGFPKYEAIL